MKQKIVIIDYDMGNVGSIVNMIKKIGDNAQISRDKNTIKRATKLILPGVGAFDSGMSQLKLYGLSDLLNEKVLTDKVPVLGVCLGMQLLAQKSEEGKLPGLSWIKADVIRFRFNRQSNKLRVPHMGWNNITVMQKNKIVDNLADDSRFYFVHSYHLNCEDKTDIIAQTNYGYDFPSIVAHGNIYGTQFHPEKSHKFGMQVYTNFLKL